MTFCHLTTGSGINSLGGGGGGIFIFRHQSLLEALNHHQITWTRALKRENVENVALENQFIGELFFDCFIKEKHFSVMVLSMYLQCEIIRREILALPPTAEVPKSS